MDQQKGTPASQAGPGTGAQDQQEITLHKVRYYPDRCDPEATESMAEGLCAYCQGAEQRLIAIKVRGNLGRYPRMMGASLVEE